MRLPFFSRNSLPFSQYSCYSSSSSSSCWWWFCCCLPPLIGCFKTVSITATTTFSVKTSLPSSPATTPLVISSYFFLLWCIRIWWFVLKFEYKKGYREREKMRRERRSRRISRIGSYAISSSMSMRDHRQQPCITCTTFNILAPIYKRLNINNDKDQNSRESDYRAYWLVRNQRILDSLLRERSSIICLQVLLSLSASVFVSVSLWFWWLFGFVCWLFQIGVGILVGKWRVGQHVWEEIRWCRLSQFQACTNQQPWWWLVPTFLLHFSSWNFLWNPFCLYI